MKSLLTIFWAFLRLGLISFGGPVAHLGYFHDVFVKRRKWIDEEGYADLVALCQFLPGPASSQVGFAIGLKRGGVAGGFLAWVGFTLPSALLMFFFAVGMQWTGADDLPGWVWGLKVAAVAVVADAVLFLGRKLLPDWPRIILSAGAMLIVLAAPLPAVQVVAILFGAFVGWILFRKKGLPPAPSASTPWFSLAVPVSRFCLILFFVMLIGLPVLAAWTHWPALDYFESYYRSGSIVFGGGHVLLPLLESEVVGRGWVSESAFLAGYGAAQAVPGPLFSFATYLGALAQGAPHGIAGATLCTVAVFLPSFLLVMGVIPYWGRLRAWAPARAALAGSNAAVVGLLAAALITPVSTSALRGWEHIALALAAFLLLRVMKSPPWVPVLLCAAVGSFFLS